MQTGFGGFFAIKRGQKATKATLLFFGEKENSEKRGAVQLLAGNGSRRAIKPLHWVIYFLGLKQLAW